MNIILIMIVLMIVFGIWHFPRLICNISKGIRDDVRSIRKEDD